MPEQSHAPTKTASENDIDVEHELTGGFAARLIRRKAKQLVGRAGFTQADRPDLEQEMTLRVWQALPKFDPAKAHWNAFVTTIVERHVATILQRARRVKRLEGAIPVSLSEQVEDCEDVPFELGATLEARHQELLTGRYVETAENLSDLKLDLEEVVAGLSQDLRRLCELLKSHNVTEAARRMGIPRTTASSMVSRLRAVFAEAGLKDFPSDPSSRGGETR